MHNFAIMTRRIVIFSLIILFLLGIESLIYNALLPLFSVAKWVEISYYAFQFGAVGSLLYVIVKARDRRTQSIKSPLSNILMGSMIAFALPKIVFSLFLVLEDITRWIRYGWGSINNQFNSDGTVSSIFPNRMELYIQVILLIALTFFLLLIYGILFGKYRYQVRKVVIESDDVPDNFHGYKIVQISDIHSGTFDSVDKVQKGIDMINAQGADLVLFTGDLVNNVATEIEPFIAIFDSIKSKDGKFSILGNHDYGDYVKWESSAVKEANLERLISNQGEMGFKMMRNANERIERNDQFINLLGVDNWGKPPFPQHGDLEKATKGITSDAFNILMSHDPSHWDYQIKEHDKDINLTLSGHTHGMQLGIDWLGIKWSPVKYRYRKWAGLYTENDRHLYVNRGFGFLGWPGRLGIWPEITSIELKKR
ncbi:MAG: putative MPP superfamily phosphohydrolase [Crocinitomicaceae bacterium]|jgi:predicted MPP superfamily phosphohydrolase